MGAQLGIPQVDIAQVTSTLILEYTFSGFLHKTQLANKGLVVSWAFDMPLLSWPYSWRFGAHNGHVRTRRS